MCNRDFFTYTSLNKIENIWDEGQDAPVAEQTEESVAVDSQLQGAVVSGVFCLAVHHCTQSPCYNAQQPV